MPGIRAGKLNVQEGAVEWTCPATLYHATVLRPCSATASCSTQTWRSGDRWRWRPSRSVSPSGRASLRGRHAAPVPEDRGELALARQQHPGRRHGPRQDRAGTRRTGSAGALRCRLRRARGHHVLDEVPVGDRGRQVGAVVGTPSSSTATPKRVKAILDAPAGTLFIINWESLRKHIEARRLRLPVTLTPSRRRSVSLNRRRLYTVIADEAHRAKDPNSKQTRALVGPSAPTRSTAGADRHACGQRAQRPVVPPLLDGPGHVPVALGVPGPLRVRCRDAVGLRADGLARRDQRPSCSGSWTASCCAARRRRC